MSGKWVMSGLFINQIPKVFYSVFEYYLLTSLGLFQMLLVVSPEPHRTIEGILGGFGVDQWMGKLHEILAHLGSQGD
jgi:hypothetical protein